MTRPDAGPEPPLVAAQSVDEAIEGAIAAGARALDQHAFQEAAAHYRAALAWLGSEAGPRKAEVHACLAEIERASDRPADALVHLEEALFAFPAHEGALRRALSICEQLGFRGKAASLRSKLLQFDLGPEERSEQLHALANDGLAIAIDALRALRETAPADTASLDRLRAAHEAAGDMGAATNAMVERAELVSDRLARAQAMVEAAGFCAKRTGETSRAVALYEAAIADDPAVEGAFEAIEHVLVDRADWPGLDKAYERQCERLAAEGATPEHASVLGRLAVLRANRLNDRAGAIDALTRRVSLEPGNVEARSVLATLLEHHGQAQKAARVLETAAWHAPSRAATYHALLRLFSAGKQHDRAFQAASALVYLGEAELDEQMLFQQYRPESGLRPSGSLTDKDWSELYPLEHDANVRALLRVIGPAAIKLRIGQNRASGKLPVLTDKSRQQVASSTVSVVRTFAWAANILQVPLPEIHVRPDTPGGISAAPGEQPAILLGKNVLSGRSVAELAFLVGRDLTYFRPEHVVLMYYTSMTELTALVTTALRMALPGGGGAASASDKALTAALSEDLDAAAWQQIRQVVGGFEASGSKIDLRGYVRSLEIAATRAGLLLSGDLPTAGQLLASDVREVAGLKAADRMRDLLPYAVSSPYAALRERLGVEAA